MPTEMKAVPGLPDYFAASDGAVWRLKDTTLAPVKSHRAKNGYRVVNVRRGPGDWVTMTVHRLVAAAWLGPPPPEAQTRHLNGDRDDNTPGNLAWGDARANSRDKRRHGRDNAGERNRAAKLNPCVAFAMREAVKMGLTQRAVAEHFRVSQATVSGVVAGKRWLPEPTEAVAAVAL